MAKIKQLTTFPRVTFGKNPLVEVIVAVRFPVQLGLTSRLPAEFQAAISEDYPLLQISKQVAHVVLSGGSQKEEQQPSEVGAVDYIFSTTDNKSRVTLSNQLLALTTTSYSCWEDFRAQFYKVLDVAVTLYKIPVFNRIGLRYKDVIVKDDLGLKEVAWEELIKPSLLSPVTLFTDQINEIPCPGYSTSINLSVEDLGKITINCGFVTDNKGKFGFLIDTDCYADPVLTRATRDIKSTLEGLHEYTSLVFKNAITDKLHDALEPDNKVRH